MDIPFTVTFGQLCAGFLAVCAGISAIAAAVSWISKAIHRLKKPNEDQNARLDAMEAKMKEYDTFFQRDKERLDGIEEGNRVIQRGVLALLSHSLDGNNTKGMEEAQKEITEYLIRK